MQFTKKLIEYSLNNIIVLAVHILNWRYWEWTDTQPWKCWKYLAYLKLVLNDWIDLTDSGGGLK